MFHLPGVGPYFNTHPYNYRMLKLARQSSSDVDHLIYYHLLFTDVKLNPLKYLWRHEFDPCSSDVLPYVSR